MFSAISKKIKAEFSPVKANINSKGKKITMLLRDVYITQFKLFNTLKMRKLLLKLATANLKSKQKKCVVLRRIFQ